MTKKIDAGLAFRAVMIPVDILLWVNNVYALMVRYVFYKIIAPIRNTLITAVALIAFAFMGLVMTGATLLLAIPFYSELGVNSTASPIQAAPVLLAPIFIAKLRTFVLSAYIVGWVTYFVGLFIGYGFLKMYEINPFTLVVTLAVPLATVLDRYVLSERGYN